MNIDDEMYVGVFPDGSILNMWTAPDKLYAHRPSVVRNINQVRSNLEYEKKKLVETKSSFFSRAQKKEKLASLDEQLKALDTIEIKKVKIQVV